MLEAITQIVYVNEQREAKRFMGSIQREEQLRKETRFKEKLEIYKLRKEIEETFERVALKCWNIELLFQLRTYQKEFANGEPQRTKF